MKSFHCSQLLDRDIDRANIGPMAHELSKLSISLEQAFAAEEKALKRIYSDNDLTTAQIVTEGKFITQNANTTMITFSP